MRSEGTADSMRRQNSWLARAITWLRYDLRTDYVLFAQAPITELQDEAN